MHSNDLDIMDVMAILTGSCVGAGGVLAAVAMVSTRHLPSLAWLVADGLGLPACPALRIALPGCSTPRPLLRSGGGLRRLFVADPPESPESPEDPKSPESPEDTKSTESPEVPEAPESPEAPDTFPLPTTAWVICLNHKHHADMYPHVRVMGRSGAGKSFFTRALLCMRDGECVILTPKRGETWPLPTISYDADGGCQTLLAAIAALHQHLKVRTQEAIPLTLVVDDYNVLVSEKELRVPLSDLVAAVARLGRYVKYRLVLVVHEAEGRATYTKGMVAIWQHFTTITLNRMHEAVWNDEGDVSALDTSDVPSLAARPWRMRHWGTGSVPVPDPVPASGTGSGTLLAEAFPCVPKPRNDGNAPVPGAFPRNDGNAPGTGEATPFPPLVLPPTEESEGEYSAQHILRWHNAGISQRAILSVLKGAKERRVRRYKEAIGER